MGELAFAVLLVVLLVVLVSFLAVVAAFLFWGPGPLHAIPPGATTTTTLR